MAALFFRAAYAYAKRLGWSVLPLVPQGKAPLTKHGFHDATTDENILREWGKRWPNANIGVATGMVSGFVVIDVDPRHGGDVSLAKLESDHGPLPDTVEEKSGGGGEHRLFLHPGGRIRSRAGFLGPGLDLKGDAAYIVIAPSVHASGNPYAWKVGRNPLERAIAELPTWLLAALTELEQASGSHGRVQEEWRALAEQGVDEGARNQTLARIAGHLLSHFVNPWLTLALLISFNKKNCRPPLSEVEVKRIVDSISALELARRKGSR